MAQWEGENAVKMGRQMLGATNPQESLPGTIRGDFSIVTGRSQRMPATRICHVPRAPSFSTCHARNICHGADSVENAEKEIKLWFGDDEVLDWDDHSNDWVYE